MAVYLARLSPWGCTAPKSLLGARLRAGRCGGSEVELAAEADPDVGPEADGSDCSLQAVETLPARELLLLKCFWEAVHLGQRRNLARAPSLGAWSQRPVKRLGAGVSERGRRDRATPAAARRTSRLPLSRSGPLCAVRLSSG